MYVSVCESVCACVCVRECVCVCVCKRESLCVCECACVCEIDRVCVYVCVCEKECLCVSESWTNIHLMSQLTLKHYMTSNLQGAVSVHSGSHY